MTVRAKDRLVIALDYPNLADALALVKRAGPEVLWYKVGLELFTVAGTEAVRALTGEGKRVFLDLKLHDIPNTVARAAARAASLGVSLIDLHIAAGEEAMRMAAGAVRDAVPAGEAPLLLGVTVLTSAKRADSGAEMDADALMAEVAARALRAKQCGLGGVVAPVTALPAIQSLCPGFPVLTPGIRPAGAAKGDQQWTATPAQAVRAGARWLVVGRPITGAPDPAQAAREILAEMDEA